MIYLFRFTSVNDKTVIGVLFLMIVNESNFKRLAIKVKNVNEKTKPNISSKLKMRTWIIVLACR